MTIYLSENMGITGISEFNQNNPVIGYDSVFKNTNIQASFEVRENKASNMWSPDTYTIWQGAFGNALGHTIQISNPESRDVDYIGIAKHNFASGRFSYEIQVSFDNGGSWATIVEPKVPQDDSAILERFTQVNGWIQVIIMPLSDWDEYTPPRIAHIKLGKLLTLQRRIYVGHQPADIAEQSKKINYSSETGNYLSHIVLRKYRKGSISQENNTPDFIREKIRPFINHLNGNLNDDYAQFTFFFSWRPGDYPDEVVYAWTNGNIIPENQGGDQMGGRMRFSSDYEAIA